MISVIICSRNKTLLARVTENIEETIGVPHEVIATDNSINQKGICSVYNEAARKAQFNLLCFVHEDVVFSTFGWGTRVARRLENKKTGLIGIAGGDTKSFVPSSWYISSKSNQINVFQHYQSRNTKAVHILVTDDNPEKEDRKVAALDGVFMCTRKDVFEQYCFDERNFPGFHSYDVDFSLQVSSTYEVMVIFDLLIHHYSEGRPGKQWMESTLDVSRKWKNRLPVSVYPLSQKEFSDHHWAAMQMFLQRLVKLEYPSATITQYFLRYSFTKYFTPRRFGSMTKYLSGLLIQRFKQKRRTSLSYQPV